MQLEYLKMQPSNRVYFGRCTHSATNIINGYKNNSMPILVRKPKNSEFFGCFEVVSNIKINSLRKHMYHSYIIDLQELEVEII